MFAEEALRGEENRIERNTRAMVEFFGHFVEDASPYQQIIHEQLNDRVIVQPDDGQEQRDVRRIHEHPDSVSLHNSKF